MKNPPFYVCLFNLLYLSSTHALGCRSSALCCGFFCVCFMHAAPFVFCMIQFPSFAGESQFLFLKPSALFMFCHAGGVKLWSWAHGSVSTERAKIEKRRRKCVKNVSRLRDHLEIIIRSDSSFSSLFTLSVISHVCYSHTHLFSLIDTLFASNFKRLYPWIQQISCHDRPRRV